ncbi:MAG: Gx transporter family protein [Eubacterium sp.]
MSKIKRISIVALSVALAFVLSFFESLVPVNIGIPGVKLGIANVVVLTALYLLPKRDAFFISMVRILISGLVFSGAFSLVYSFAGGLLSFLVMIAAMRCRGLSIMGVSVLGALSHNAAQILVAAIVMNTYRIAYYLPVLLISAAVAGVAVGVLGGVVVKRLERVVK